MVDTHTELAATLVGARLADATTARTLRSWLEGTAVAAELVVVVVVVVMVEATLVVAKPGCCCTTVDKEITDGAEKEVDGGWGAEADDDTDSEQEEYSKDGLVPPLLDTVSTLGEVLHTETGGRCRCGWGCRCGCGGTAWCGSLTAGTWLDTADATLGMPALVDTAGLDTLLTLRLSCEGSGGTKAGSGGCTERDVAG